jgi:hypothetical protein
MPASGVCVNAVERGNGSIAGLNGRGDGEVDVLYFRGAVEVDADELWGLPAGGRV